MVGDQCGALFAAVLLSLATPQSPEPMTDAIRAPLRSHQDGKTVLWLALGLLLLAAALVYYFNSGALKVAISKEQILERLNDCLLYTSPSPRDKRQSRMPSSA